MRSTERQRGWIVGVMLAMTACSSAPPPPAEPEPVVDEFAEARPRYAEAVRLIGQRRDEEAGVLLGLLTETYPSLSGPWVNLGLIHQRAGREHAAERAFQQALARDAGNAVALGQLGVLKRQQGSFEQAEQAYLRALAADPDYPFAHLNYGILLDLYLQQPAQALAHYERFQALTADSAPADGPEIELWIAELRRRLQQAEGSATASR